MVTSKSKKAVSKSTGIDGDEGPPALDAVDEGPDD